ncbi:calcium-binding protein [Microseira sp. BLCC-F43]|uniref:calcium-binding protein n=1 Tax=Microseira sp. BLCC-F43 TaxID=3153602 RepID=UPI0035B7238A
MASYPTNGNDTIFGTQNNNSIDALAGDDWVYGDYGNDTLHGGANNDAVIGSWGNDYLYGDDGNDTLGFSSTHDEIGDDYLNGGNGNDKLYAGTGNDTLLGMSGNDELYGGDGNDRLDGYATSGTEYDTLQGGAGSDTFVLGGWWGVSYQSTGYALITDWEWQYDWIEIPGNASQYQLKTGNWRGGSALDTVIYLKGTDDFIAIIQDSTNVDFARDFRFV